MASTAQILLHDRPTPLPAFVAASVAGHVLIVALWLLVGWLLAGPKVDLTQVPIKASLVRLAQCYEHIDVLSGCVRGRRGCDLWRLCRYVGWVGWAGWAGCGCRGCICCVCCCGV